MALNEQNNNIIKQNNALKEELKKVYLTVENLKNKTQTNQINHPSSQNFPMGSYASSLTYNLNNTPQSSNTRKRPNEAVAEESARKKNQTTNIITQPIQKSLLNFNSFNPAQKASPIIYNNNPNNNGYIVAGAKQAEKRQRNLQNKQYTQNVGRGLDSNLIARQRKFFVYFGNISISATKEDVEKELKRILNNIQYDDFVEINENDPNRKFTSFKFSIGYLDKEIINNKDIWPRYSIVNKFKLSLEEWKKISANSSKKSNNTTALNTNSASSSASLTSNIEKTASLAIPTNQNSSSEETITIDQ